MTEHNSPTAMTDKRSESFRKAYAPLIASRLDNLHKMTSDPTYAHQKENIALSIRLYETGEIPKGFGSIWMANGKILEDAPNSVEKGVAIWAEGIHHQLSNYDTTKTLSEEHAAPSPAIVQNSGSVFSSSKVLLEEPLSPNVPVASSGVENHAAPSPAVVQNSGSVFSSSKVLLEESLSPNVPAASSGVGDNAAPSSAVVVPVASSGPHSFNQFVQYVSYGLVPESYTHEILARVRLLESLGAIERVSIVVTIGYDTGSDIQTVYSTDLEALFYDPHTYQGNLGVANILTANGSVHRNTMLIELQLIRHDGSAVTNWFIEKAVITHPPQHFRLSGLAMRRKFYFATCPGNQLLYVAEKKAGIIAQLPAL